MVRPRGETAGVPLKRAGPTNQTCADGRASFKAAVMRTLVPMTTLNALDTIPKDLQKELKDAFGIVPSFARATTPEGLRMWWTQLRDFQLSDKTALSPKVKELIGLGVAAQIPCDYCATFHTEAARLNGATEAELQETIYMAGLTRQGSTLLNGAQVDMEVFRKEMNQIVTHLQNGSETADLVHARR